MAKLKGELQADNGDALYPHTSSDVVFGPDGKNVQEQINVLSSDRGYLTGKKLLDANVCVHNGKYICNLNTPRERGTYLVDVSTEHTDNLVQYATCVYTESGDTQGAMYKRVRIFGTWKEWKRIATTDKIDISSLCVNGWKLSEYRHGIVSKVGGCVIANLSVSGGGKNYGTVIFQLPQGYRPSTTIDIQAHCYEKSTGGWQYAVLHVDINGNVCVSNVPINDSVVFTLSFPVA